MACEKHGYTNNVLCPACDLEAKEHEMRSSNEIAGQDFDMDLGRVDQIRRAQRSARPTNANPAWMNCHHDCNFLLSFIDNLWKEYSRSQRISGPWSERLDAADSFAEVLAVGRDMSRQLESMSYALVLAGNRENAFRRANELLKSELDAQRDALEPAALKCPECGCTTFECDQCANRISQPPSEDLEAMRADAARYEWMREFFGQLICHTDRDSVTLLEVNPQLFKLDPSSLDRAIDKMMDDEDRAAETKPAAQAYADEYLDSKEPPLPLSSEPFYKKVSADETTAHTCQHGYKLADLADGTSICRGCCGHVWVGSADDPENVWCSKCGKAKGDL